MVRDARDFRLHHLWSSLCRNLVAIVSCGVLSSWQLPILDVDRAQHVTEHTCKPSQTSDKPPHVGNLWKLRRSFSSGRSPILADIDVDIHTLFMDWHIRALQVPSAILETFAGLSHRTVCFGFIAFVNLTSLGPHSLPLHCHHSGEQQFVRNRFLHWWL